MLRLILTGIRAMPTRFRSRIILCGLLSAAAAAALCPYGARTVSQEAQTSYSPSLRQKAKARGRYVVYVFPHGLKRYDDLGALVRDSDMVVEGRIYSKVSSLDSSTEDNITTDCQLRVANFFKGAERGQDTVTLNLIGGSVQFDDGTYAEMKIPDYWKNPEVGRTYIFF